MVADDVSRMVAGAGIAAVCCTCPSRYMLEYPSAEPGPADREDDVMRWKMSLAGQFLLLQLTIVLLAVGAVAAVSLAQSYATFRSEQGRRLTSVADTVGNTPTVKADVLKIAEIRRTYLAKANKSGEPPPDIDKLLEPDDQAVLQTCRLRLSAEAERVRGESSGESAGASYEVSIGDAQGRLLTGSDYGRAAMLGESAVLSRKGGWYGLVNHGRTYVAHVPILDDDGELAGFVIAGRPYPTVAQMLASATPNLLVYLLLGATLGLAGSLLLARRIKRQTLGLEPAEIRGLVEHREAMLHGIKEGVVGTDANDRVNLVNDEAIRLLGLPRDVVGRSLRGQPMEPRLRAVLIGEVTGSDQVVLRDNRILVLNRMPVLVRRHRVGWVTTLRDHTELTALQRELDVSRHTTNTLRAQAHEFANRLHTIAGLLALGEYDEVVGYVVRASQAQESLTRAVTSSVGDPSLAALLIAKASLAAEHGVQLRIAPESAMPAVDDALSADLVTVVGNLIDNALDELGTSGWVEVGVRTVDDELAVTVRDSGPGVAPELAEAVFDEGYTTKDAARGHHGLGLALTRLICTRRGGVTEVCGSTFSARIPLRSKVAA
jgi:sensor histidine kinase regulating citrate/malate metabolism